jgi:hypothetical protein
MKLIGPVILVLTIALSMSLVWFPKAVATLIAVMVLTVLVGISVTFYADVKAGRAKEEG